MCGDRTVAVTTELPHQGALGFRGGPRDGVIQDRKDFLKVRSNREGFDPDNPLPRGRKHLFERQRVNQLRLENPQAVDPRLGEQGGADSPLTDLVQSGFHIPPQKLDLEGSVLFEGLDNPPRAARSQDCPRGESLQAGGATGDQAVTWIGARQEGREGEVRVQRGGDILEAVHREIHLAGK